MNAISDEKKKNACGIIEKFNLKDLKLKLNSDSYIASYIYSYPILLKSSDSLVEHLKEDAALAISHIVYSWMPTILKDVKIEDKYWENIIPAQKISGLDKASKHIKKLLSSSPINNSWVGLSKVLHFINPNVFPIWDSNVAACFDMYSRSTYNKQCVYDDYLQFIFSNFDRKKVSEVKSIYEEHAKYRISKVRALEFLMFIAGGEILQKRKEKRNKEKASPSKP